MNPTQITLRDLFWVLTLAGVLVAWWVDRIRANAVNEQLREEKREVEERLRLNTLDLNRW